MGRIQGETVYVVEVVDRDYRGRPITELTPLQAVVVPGRSGIKPFSTAYIKYIVPRLANAITQNPDAYEYLSRTSRAFHTADRVEHMMQEAGFVATGYKPYMFGTMAIHWAQKPAA